MKRERIEDLGRLREKLNNILNKTFIDEISLLCYQCRTQEYIFGNQ